MIPSHRQAFNAAFSQARYEAYVRDLERRAGTELHFHLSETPCFFPASLMRTLKNVSLEFLHQLLDNAEYRKAADAIVPERFRVANAEARPTFVCVDFGMLMVDGKLEARLVELQAFASLYGFQLRMAESAMHAYELHGLTPFLGGLNHESYTKLVGQAILNGHDPREVVLMEIDPRNQKTWPDFQVTEDLWGVRAIDEADVIKEGRRLFYKRDGKLTRIARVYNRIIPDELEHKGLTLPFDYRDDLDVEWAGGPDWFFRVSKFAIPWLKHPRVPNTRHPWVPETKYLSDVTALPENREEWLLKPLFSFAGGGIIFAPTDEQIAAIPANQRHLYVLQERIHFTPVIETPHGATQAEVRIMMVRDGGSYRAVLPLIRMGRGKMMGVDYNKGLAWVGATSGLVDETL